MDNRMKDFADNCWKDLFDEVKDAAVYLDNAAAECLHWYTGDQTINKLQYAGAIAVRELSMHNFRDAGVAKAQKATFVCTSTDPKFYQHTLQRIINMNRFQACTVICSAHSSVLQYNYNSDTENADSYHNLKCDISRWMKVELKQEPIVEIIFRPIFTALINENLFVTPPFWNLIPPSSNEELGKVLEAEIDHFVSLWHSMFTNFNLREDIYFIGNLSEIVAEKLEKLPAAIDRRKRLIGKAGISLILVDRTLDFCTATSHNTESLLGKILSTLPHLPHHHNDVAVNMTALCPDGDGVENYSIYCAPGCLASNDSNMLNLFIRNKQKDVLITLQKLLCDISLPKESPIPRIATRITAHSLEKLIHKFRNIDDVQQIAHSSKILQQIIAAIEALKSNKTAQIELMISLEKLILQNLAVSRDSSSILAQLSSIIKTRSTRGLTLENLLTLLVYIYSLAGTEIHLPEQQENEVKDALAKAIFEDVKDKDQLSFSSDTSIYFQSSKLFDKGPMSTEKSLQIAKDIMQKLHDIARMRKSLQKYRSLMLKPSPQEIAQCIGILQQMVTDLLDPHKPEIPDLECKTFSRITAGFNLLLKGRMKQHPADNDCIIIYVMGGVAAEEIRIVQDIVSSRKSHCQVMLAGSRLLRPFDVMNHVLLNEVFT